MDSNHRPYGYEPHELPLLYSAILFKERLQNDKWCPAFFPIGLVTHSVLLDDGFNHSLILLYKYKESFLHFQKYVYKYI